MNIKYKNFKIISSENFIIFKINNSLELIQPNGFILCDDVIIKNENYFKESNSDSFRAINELEEKKVINVRYILKRLKYKKYKKKFIAIITKN